jgi:hypothetical protein
MKIVGLGNTASCNVVDLIVEEAGVKVCIVLYCAACALVTV